MAYGCEIRLQPYAYSPSLLVSFPRCLSRNPWWGPTVACSISFWSSFACASSCRRRRLAVSPSRLVASSPRHLVALPPRLAASPPRRLVAAVPDRHLSHPSFARPIKAYSAAMALSRSVVVEAPTFCTRSIWTKRPILLVCTVHIPSATFSRSHWDVRDLL